MSTLAATTTQDFDQTIAGEVPVLVDFWAEWCAPCRAVAPILEEIASERTGKLRIVKLNIDENPDIGNRYGVMSIPTMILFAEGQERTRLVGARGKEQLLKDLDPHLA